MLKSKLAALLFAAASLVGVGPAAGAEAEPIKTLEDLVQAATEGRATPGRWKAGWTWEAYNEALDGCTKTLFSNVMKASRPQSWWPSAPGDAVKIPSTLLWMYGTIEAPKLARYVLGTCACTVGNYARGATAPEFAAAGTTVKNEQVAEKCANEAKELMAAEDKAARS